jgi:CspA family cold shock protein
MSARCDDTVATSWFTQALERKGLPGRSQDPFPAIQESIMASGKVKWFDNKKGFGFIAQESGQDIFVHYSSIEGGGFKTLNEGEEVSFDVISGDKGLKAQNVHRVQAP